MITELATGIFFPWIKAFQKSVDLQYNLWATADAETKPFTVVMNKILIEKKENVISIWDRKDIMSAVDEWGGDI